MTRGVGGESPANVTVHLKGMEFPASKQDLTDQAERNRAPSEVMDAIGRMPDGDFQSMADVMKAYGEGQHRGDESHRGGSSDRANGNSQRGGHRHMGSMD